MFFDWLLVYGLSGPIGPCSPAALECLELVKRFDPAKYRGSIDVRDRIEKELTERPGAVWPVLWGSQHRNADVSARCVWILHVWKTRREENRYREIVRNVDGDFDRFLNALLHSSAPDLGPFAAAADTGRAFDKYFVKKSFSSMSAVSTEKPGRTPFGIFSEYLEKATPVVSKAPSEKHPFGTDARYLARCDSLKTDRLSVSIVLSQANIDVRDSVVSLFICGGDAVLFQSKFSMIFAAGDVTLGEGFARRVLVVAGGKVSLRGHPLPAMIVSPKPVDIAPRVNLSKSLLILDGKPKPAPDLFTFRDLWTDYGLDAVMDQARPKIAKIRPESDFSSLFKEGDLIESIRTKKIESLGQFRRLLRLALDTGEFNFEIERAGKKMAIRADLKKKQP